MIENFAYLKDMEALESYESLTDNQRVDHSQYRYAEKYITEINKQR